MMQYLLNMTFIWLFSLLIFDLFLRNDTFHNYNRLYLLASLLAGLLIPLYSGQSAAIIHSSFATSWEQASIAKAVVTQPAVTAASSLPSTTIAVLAVIYGAGALVALFLLLKDIFQLFRHYRHGKQSREDAWLIIETGSHHAPFSVFNHLFVQSRQQYTSQEWRMILMHEGQHTRLLHFADLLLLQLIRISCWFHPLVYAFHRRILIVHEYQADACAGDKATAYGKFLLEQTLLSAAPRVAHSFNQSPIKKRITMLTRKSSAIAKSKLFLFIPLVIVSLMLFSKQGFSLMAVKDGSVVHFNGNTIELTQELRDTISLEDPATGKTLEKVVIRDPNPVKLNGEKVFQASEVQYPAAYNGNGNSLDEYLMNGIQGQLSSLPDGIYRFTAKNILIDKNGKLVYYEIEGPIRRDSKTNKDLPIDNKIKQRLQNTLASLLMNAPGFKPAKQNGQPVPFLLKDSSPFTWMQSFTIKNNQLILQRRK